MKVIFKVELFLVLSALVASCSEPGGAIERPDASTLGNVHASDVPIGGLPLEEVTGFDTGDSRFELTFRPADGIGPLYVRAACSDCHSSGGRGPGLVQKMSVVEADGTTTSSDQSELPFGHTLRPLLAAGATTKISAPSFPDIKVSTRLGPPVLGRGYMEAVPDEEIERVAALQAERTDGIHGRPNHLDDGSIGRFGVKARLATLLEFAADAYQGDMGLTSPMKPAELPNPDGLTDDLKPGVDLSQNDVDVVAFYVQRIAIPVRVPTGDAGKVAFDAALCSVCHVPTMHTSSDALVGILRNLDAPIYSDLLLHDMGPALADGMTEGSAGGRDFRTAPLIGIRFLNTLLHDGRVRTVADAIAAHDGEAAVSRAAFQSLSTDDQESLLEFVEAL